MLCNDKGILRLLRYNVYGRKRMCMCTLRPTEWAYVLQYIQYIIKKNKITGTTRVQEYESNRVEEYESKRVEHSRVRGYKRTRVQHSQSTGMAEAEALTLHIQSRQLALGPRHKHSKLSSALS